MDDILLEDYSDFEKQYPFWSDGLDYEDRPGKQNQSNRIYWHN